MSTQLEDLKQEATELGISFKSNIGADTLKDKIEKFYESQETSSKELESLMEKVEPEPAKKPAVKSISPREQKRIDRETNSRKTRVITVVDNDQRVNSHVTTCTVSCSNEFFDLGTKVLPLNEKIEVSQGHINVLKSVQIPLHVKDVKTGLSSVRMRPRYTISYEDNHA